MNCNIFNKPIVKSDANQHRDKMDEINVINFDIVNEMITYDRLDIELVTEQLTDHINKFSFPENCFKILLLEGYPSSGYDLFKVVRKLVAENCKSYEKIVLIRLQWNINKYDPTIVDIENIREASNLVKDLAKIVNRVNFLRILDIVVAHSMGTFIMDSSELIYSSHYILLNPLAEMKNYYENVLIINNRFDIVLRIAKMFEKIDPVGLYTEDHRYKLIMNYGFDHGFSFHIGYRSNSFKKEFKNLIAF